MKAIVPIECLDGTVIQSTHFEPSGPAHATILVGGATGVPQGFYARFAQFANERGYSVTTLDYRGVGLSAPKQLRGYEMNYLDWGRQDLAAALAATHDTSKPSYMIGHSYGGHALGLMPNHKLVDRFCTFGTGAGWAGYMPLIERIKVGIMWNVLGPISTPFLGYMPGKALGLGENLPIDVYRQWKRWCQSPNYFFSDPAVKDSLTDFAKVTTPIRAVNALDDLWAGTKSRDAFFANYSVAPIDRVTLDHKVIGQPMGHMGYFRKGREALWEDALRWFEKRNFS